MRFAGKIGFAINTEVEPGSFQDVITEHLYRGEVQKVYGRVETGDQINDNLNISNTISIIADPFAHENLFAIRYVIWMGTAWKVTSIDVARPRLVLSIGGVYNGQRPEI